MKEIPRDIQETAKDAFYAAWDEGHCGYVAKAIFAERQRCMKIASYAANMKPGDALGRNNGPEHQQGCADAGAWILAEIEAGA